MATPAAAPNTPAPNAPAKAEAQDAYGQKEAEKNRAEILKALADTKAAANTQTPDTVGAHYKIQMNSPLPEFDTQLAKAYTAQDTRDPTRILYALVCSHRMPPRGKVIKSLLGVNIPHLAPLAAQGVVPLTGVSGNRMVLVYEKPRGRSLAAIMAERGNKPFPETFITEHIIAPIASVVQYLSELRLCHGRINPNNIFFGESVTLGECASEPCGYSQSYLYEPPPRAQAHIAGKGEGSAAQDYFALGVLAAYLRIGPRIFEGSGDIRQHIFRLLHDGSYQGYVRNIEFSDGLTDLLRGTLNDSATERWTWQQIKSWAAGRRFNMLPPAPPPSASRPFQFDKEPLKNLRDLSHALFLHWDQASVLLRDGTLARWVDLSARRKDIAETLRKAVNSLGGNIARSSHHNDELVARAVTILDPDAPLSMKEVRAHVDGIGCMLAESIRTGTQQHTQYVTEIIEQGTASVWADMHRKREQELPGDLSNALWTLDRIRITLRMPGMGFGLERCLYDLNPDLPCQSPLIGDHYAGTLRELLTALELVAPEKARHGPPIDRHIAGFIASKLNISREFWLSNTNHMKDMAKLPSVLALQLLMQAQEAAGKIKLPALSLWISAELLSIVEQFKSRTIRDQAFRGLRQMSGYGLLRPVYEFLNNNMFVEHDRNGFEEAQQRYQRCTQEMAMLRSRQIMGRRAALVGYSIAKYIAHGVLMVMALMVLNRHFFL